MVEEKLEINFFPSLEFLPVSTVRTWIVLLCLHYDLVSMGYIKSLKCQNFSIMKFIDDMSLRFS